MKSQSFPNVIPPRSEKSEFFGHRILYTFLTSTLGTPTTTSYIYLFTKGFNNLCKKIVKNSLPYMRREKN